MTPGRGTPLESTIVPEIKCPWARIEFILKIDNNIKYDRSLLIINFLLEIYSVNNYLNYSVRNDLI